MTTYVEGFRTPDEEWKTMKTVYDICVKAKVSIPDEVMDFFQGQPPSLEDEARIDISMAEKKRTDNVAQDVYEVNVSKLPKGVKIIRFINSY